MTVEQPRMPKARKRWVIVAGAVVVAAGAVAGVALVGGNREPTPTPTPVVVEPGTGDRDFVIAAAGDADMTFEVVRLACGPRRLGTAEEPLEAEGQFCLSRLLLTNDDAERRSLDLSCQFLVDEEGTHHPVHREATMASLERVAQSWVVEEGVPPGETANGVQLVFDVPAEAAEASLLLRGSCESPGLLFQLPQRSPD